MIGVVRQHQFDRLPVEVHHDVTAVGQAAARRAASVIQAAIETHGQANLIIATGNSQLTFLAALAKLDGLPWDRVQLFHMDEYVGLSRQHPASFRRFLRDKLADLVQPRAVHELAGDADDLPAECERYASLLRAHPADLCCLGFGENGHLAFNDPDRARFDDPAYVKLVTLDDSSRRQQVGEGHFARLADVPEHALSLTIPALLAARQVLAIVPERRKAVAVRAALLGPITTDCPASILRQTPHARAYLDDDSFSLVDGAG
jgi:glucosamine-6-phosphate deaminase